VLTLHRTGHSDNSAARAADAGVTTLALADHYPPSADRLDGSVQFEQSGTSVAGQHEQALCVACATLTSLEHATIPAPFTVAVTVSAATSSFAPYSAHFHASTLLPFSRAPPVIG
jgi:hypothetical protein